MEPGGAARRKVCHGSEFLDTLKTAALPLFNEKTGDMFETAGNFVLY
jgi:hypothetical protein